MKRLPQAALIIDLKSEAIAVRECERLQIPILGLVDSNVDPVSVAASIPGSDDSMRSCRLVISTIGEGVEDAANAYREAEAKRAARRRRRASCRGRGEGAARGRGRRARRPRRRPRPAPAASQPAQTQGQPQQPAAPTEAG